MTAPPASDRRSDDTRIAAIRDRLELLRRQTDELTARSVAVAERSREARQAASRACNHAAQVEQMRESLQQVEHELEGLRVAMNTRSVIEQAKGMLMLQQHCDADTAFEMLVSLSQTSHRKLVEVARTLVSTWSAADGSA